MPESSGYQYLQRHGAARARLKDIVEGPDPALDRIIRSVREARGAINGKLRAEYPILERLEIAADVVRAIREEFPWELGTSDLPDVYERPAPCL